MIWALGPRLIVASFDVGLPLPEMLMRFVPVVSNARVPGRAMVLVYLALGVLMALRLGALDGRWRGAVFQWALIILLAIDYLGAPIPLTQLAAPAVYQRLASIDDQEPVCEVPFGIGDGLTAGLGNQDREILYFATLHEHPLVGGFIGRMPPGVAEAYTQMPVVGNLLRLSSGQAAVPNGARHAPPPCHYLVVDVARASAELKSYIHTALDLQLLAVGQGRELYVVR